MRKYITIIAAIILLAGAFSLFKALKNNKKAVFATVKKSLPLAYTQVVENKSIPVTIPASGSIIAKNRFKLYSEVQGILEIASKEFKPGIHYKKGELIYKLNSEEFYTNLLSQKSSFQNLIVSMMPDLRLDFPESFDLWQVYLNTFDISKPLAVLPKSQSEKEKRFIASKNIFTNYYSIKNLEIKLEKYSIYAPFDGVLTDANITPGTLVSPGQLIGEFVDPSTFEMEVSIKSSLISKLEIGDEVEVLNLEKENIKYPGKIIRINKKVDLNSQTVNIFIELKGKDLIEGMFLKALLTSKVLENIVEIPRNLLINQNQIYTISDSTISLKDIHVVYENEQSIMVRGLKTGQTIVAKPVPKAFDGMKVIPMVQ